MLIIRNQQMEELGECSLLVFVERVISIFSEKFPDEVQKIPQQQMKLEFLRLVQEARNFGLVQEKEVFTYLWAAKYLGEDFATVYPEAREVMSSTTLASETKTLWLQKWTLAVLQAQTEG